MRRLLSAWAVLATSGCGGTHRATSASEGGDAGENAGGRSGARAELAGSATGGARAGGGAAGSVTSEGAAPQGGTASGGGASAASGGGGGAGAPARGGRGGAPAEVAGGAPTAGAGPAVPTCSFAISASLSPNIGTVGVVDWSTDLQGVTGARIEFTLDDPRPDELNVGSGGSISLTDSRALLLGLKPGRSYTYRIVATAGSTECVSADHQLVTEMDPNAPTVTRTAGDHAAARARGFVVTCGYSGHDFLAILDTDGAVVWWTDPGIPCSQVHMDWDGQYMWALSPNPTDATFGDVRRVRMDGSGLESIQGLVNTHHDFAVLPGGTTAFLVWADTAAETSELVERAPDGTLHTVAPLDQSTLGSSATKFHANALRYYARDDTYTVSDLSTSGVYRFDRRGTVTWQFTGFYGMHGHELLANGNFLYFEAHYGSLNQSTSAPSPVYEYSFSDRNGTLASTQEWLYEGTASSVTFGDVWRLPNGNTLITYTTGSTMNEVTRSDEILWSFAFTSQIGYSDFRETLYGPPLPTP